MIHVFASIALLIFIAELGDKTMISTITIALATRRHVYVLLLSTLGFTLASMIVAYGGYLVQFLLNPLVLRLLASILFIVVGLAVYFARERDLEEYKSLGLLTCLLIVFLSEMGDKTQLVVFSSSLLWSSPLIVVSASALGYLLANIVGLITARCILAKISWSTLKRAISLIMVLIGIITLVSNLLS